ncbi:hypothetical protein DERF_013907 [Dermatophagoides farinae]|uniref:Uncharacterized protein n=1 Tax=Dermatophagoides farinae TaxID=6954 RepID=A0A922HNJ6_DERFA|nr:hypothetical protein DERF_013907 [Dermatophagoides farinae]
MKKVKQQQQQKCLRSSLKGDDDLHLDIIILPWTIFVGRSFVRSCNSISICVDPLCSSAQHKKKNRYGKHNKMDDKKNKNGIPPKNGPKPPVDTFPPGPSAIERPTANPLVNPPPCGPTLPPTATGLALAVIIVIIRSSSNNPAKKLVTICIKFR